MTDPLLLALTAGMSWALWRALEEWGDMAACWAWAWAWWVARMMRAI
jgi:hypothetical protein